MPRYSRPGHDSICTVCTKVWQSFIWHILFHPLISQIKFSAQFSGIQSPLVTNECVVIIECIAISYCNFLTIENEYGDHFE